MMFLTKKLFACAMLFTSAFAATSSCYAAVDATVSTAWVKADSNQYFQSAKCPFSPTAFAQDTTANPPSITISADENICEKAYIPNTGFGIFNCNMKPPGVAGTVTTCMIESSTFSPYENVYIKFFGNDTTQVYIGFYSSGIVNQAGPIKLSFDPTADFHKYGIEYAQSYIKWYIDGVERSSEYGYRPIPLTPNRFTIALTIEDGVFQGEDTKYPTDNNVDRVYVQQLSVLTSAKFANLTYVPMSGNGCNGSAVYFPTSMPLSNAECDTRAPLAIYNDSPVDGWTIASSDSNNLVNTADTETYAGVGSVSFTPLRGDIIFSSNKPFLTTDYYGFEFWLKSRINGLKVSVYGIFPGGSRTDPVSLSTLVKTGYTEGVWTRTVVPFTALGLSVLQARSLTGFGLTFPDSTQYGFKVFLDVVYLTQQLPICNNQTRYIYREGLEDGVNDQSYGGYSNVNYVGNSYAGSKSVSWDILAFNGLTFKFDKPISTNDWKAISMRVNFRNMTGTTWTMYFTSNGGQRAGAAPLNVFQYLGGIIPQGVQPQADWPLIVIPFYEFGIGSGVDIDGMVIASNAPGFQGTLYFDNIAAITDVAAENEGGDSSSASFTTFSSFSFFLVAVAYLFL